jgi:hypothetical protein
MKRVNNLKLRISIALAVLVISGTAGLGRSGRQRGRLRSMSLRQFCHLLHPAFNCRQPQTKSLLSWPSVV